MSKDKEKDTKETNENVNQKVDESAKNESAEVKAEEKQASASAQETVAETKTQEEYSVDELKKKNEEMNNQYLRLMAEFDNYKKRMSRDYERLVESANEKLMLEMVDVRENFDRALKSGEKGSEFQSFFDGMKLIFTKFNDVLTKNGLETFAEPGEEFDPQSHDALMKVSHAEIPVDHIAEVFEKGYKLKSRIIKHAKVLVSSGKPVEQSQEENKTEQK